MKSIMDPQTATGACGSHAKPGPSVVQEHISILREIKAPATLIEVAERVAANTETTKKK